MDAGEVQDTVVVRSYAPTGRRTRLAKSRIWKPVYNHDLSGKSVPTDKDKRLMDYSPVPSLIQVYKWGPANYFMDNLTKCWEVTCHRLVSHSEEVEILLVASYYIDKLRPDGPLARPITIWGRLYLAICQGSRTITKIQALACDASIDVRYRGPTGVIFDLR